MPAPPSQPETTVIVAPMDGRAAVRAVTTPLRDLPGVVAIDVDPDQGRIRVVGTADSAAVRAVIEALGHRVLE